MKSPKKLAHEIAWDVLATGIMTEEKEKMLIPWLEEWEAEIRKDEQKQNIDTYRRIFLEKGHWGSVDLNADKEEKDEASKG